MGRCSECGESDCESDDSTCFDLQWYEDRDKPEFLYDVISQNMVSLQTWLEMFRACGITFQREDELEKIRECAHDKDLPLLCSDVAQYEDWDDEQSSSENTLHVRSTAHFFAGSIDTILKCNNHLLHLRDSNKDTA